MSRTSPRRRPSLENISSEGRPLQRGGSDLENETSPDRQLQTGDQGKRFLAMFFDGTFKYGTTRIGDKFYNGTISEKISILKSGFIPFTNDLFLLLSSLLGTSTEDIYEQQKVLWLVTKGHTTTHRHGLFSFPGENVAIAVLRPATSSEAISRIAHHMTIISVNGGKRWQHMVCARTREAELSVWVKLYYEQLLLNISFYPIAEYFLYDFRYITVMKHADSSSEGRFLPKEMYIADHRSMEEIKGSVTNEYSKSVNSPQRVGVYDMTFEIPSHIRSPEKHSLKITRRKRSDTTQEFRNKSVKRKIEEAFESDQYPESGEEENDVNSNTSADSVSLNKKSRRE